MILVGKTDTGLANITMTLFVLSFLGEIVYLYKLDAEGEEIGD